MNRAGCFVLFIAACLLVGILLVGLYEVSQKNQANVFLQGVTKDLTGISQTQAEALKAEAEADREQAKADQQINELTLMLGKEKINETRSAMILNTVLAVLLSVCGLCFVILLLYAFPHIRNDVKLARAKGREK